MNTLTDVDIVVEGHGDVGNIIALFIKKMRSTHKIDHKWILTTKKYSVSRDQKTAKKTNENNWAEPIYSELPVTDSVTYVEIELHEGAHLLFFGVSKTNQVGTHTFLDRESTICLFTDRTSLSSKAIKCLTDCTAKKGDTLGMVVDKGKQKILFFRNGQLIAEGTKTPAEMEPLYLVVWLYYHNSSFTMCNKHPYNTLVF